MKLLMRITAQFAVCILVLFSVALIIDDSLVDPSTGMRIYGAGSILLLVLLIVSEKIKTLTPFCIILLYAVISSFGYSILVFLYGDRAYTEICSIRHAYTAYFNEANAICYICCTLLLAGYLLGERKKEKGDTKSQGILGSKESKVLSQFASTIIWLYACYLLLSVLTGRMPLSNYAEVKEWTSTQPLLMYGLRLVWIAIPTYLYVENSIKFRSFIIPVLMISIIFIFTGNRNEAMYPLAIGCGVYLWKRYKTTGKGIPIWVTIGIIVVVFIINPLISSTRQEGLSLADFVNGSFGFYDALLEMGQQINPFSITLYALDKTGAHLQYGMTILVPTLVILSLRTIYASGEYLYSAYNPSYILEKLGHTGRGYNIFAELYYNFGCFGAFLLSFIFGRYAARCEKSIIGSRRALVFFQLGTLFIVWVRNVFGFNCTIVIFTIIIDLAAYFVAASSGSSTRVGPEQSFSNKMLIRRPNGVSSETDIKSLG